VVLEERVTTEWCVVCAVVRMPTVECHVNGLLFRDGVKAAQSNLNTATTNKMKWETDNIVFGESSRADVGLAAVLPPVAIVHETHTISRR
jgi:hypothetical protein